jgi:uncharacterized protein (TIGR01777 family)
METVLIAGGSGFIGSKLSENLEKNNFKVTFLSRKKSKNSHSFFWDLNTDYIDIEAVKNADYVINLTGANIGSQRWTNSYKSEIINSRIKSTDLIFNTCKENNFKPKVYISASAVGYYGTITTDQIFNENDNPGNDFLAEVCRQWEEKTLKFNNLGIRTIILRSGVVFSEKNGAFLTITNQVKKGIGAIISTGQQYIPWIHIEDLSNIYKFCIENKHINGIYNCAAPNNITNKILTEKIAKYLDTTIRLPHIPDFVLKLKFGEMSSIILNGSRVTSDKIINQGFKFKFENIDSALDDLLK